MALSRKKVLNALARDYTDGAKLSELATEFDLSKHERRRLRLLLDRLIDRGEVVRIARGRYVLADASGEGTKGRISVHPAGYGFVALEDGGKDVFVPERFRGASLDGDWVELSTWEGYKGTEGRVERVLSRGRARLTGILYHRGRTTYVEPDDPRIATDHGNVFITGGKSVPPGKSILIEITNYPTVHKPTIRGRFVRVLGDPEDPRTEMEKIIACAGIPDQFPESALAQASATPQRLKPKDLADRVDLRDREFVTIDPESARDFDDALCIEQVSNDVVRVWVAVADVSHYVQFQDALDKEAAIRGVSVYLPDRVVPMLPFELSSGICSLNPNVDRCAMVARLDFDLDGKLLATGVVAAVIRSRARLDYPGVAAVLTGDLRGRRERYRPWVELLCQLDGVAKALRKKRIARGALVLEVSEPKVILDADDAALIRDVVRAKEGGDVQRAYHLVEEFMIAANEAVGSFFLQHGLDVLWRAHAPPKRARMEELAVVLRSYGIAADEKELQTPMGMARILKQVEESPARQALYLQVLRSLQQAVYQTHNVGHFGLASAEYLHFTSPIRRYPDVWVHRLLKRALHQQGFPAGGGGNFPPPSPEDLECFAVSSSAHERRALEAEREAVAMCRAYVMRDQVGEQFSSRIVGVTNFGVFVEIEEPYVEALVKLEWLGDDRFHFDPIKMQLRGKRTGAKFSLGDIMQVEIVNVSVAAHRIDARFIGSESAILPVQRRKTVRKRARSRKKISRRKR